MSFNKRYISKESLKLKANNCSNFKDFYNYFKVDALILEDSFSFYIFEKIKEYTLKDEDKIYALIEECKKYNY